MTQNAFWMPVVAAILSSIAALAGVIIANRLADKSKREERQDARMLAADDRRRAAGEALYRSIFEITLNQSATIESSLGFLRGAVAVDNYKKRLVQTEEILSKIDKAGMRLSTETYFPDLSSEFEQFSKEIERSMSFNDELVRHLEDEGLDRKDFAKRSSDLNKDLEKIGFALCSKIAKQIK